jgi:hypothetical protein
MFQVKTKIIIIATHHRRHLLLLSWHLVELQANEGHQANFADDSRIIHELMNLNRSEKHTIPLY